MHSNNDKKILFTNMLHDFCFVITRTTVVCKLLNKRSAMCICHVRLY